MTEKLPPLSLSFRCVLCGEDKWVVVAEGNGIVCADCVRNVNATFARLRTANVLLTYEGRKL